MKVAGLFAGIGGLELGLGASGFEAALLCEIAPHARAVLDARFPSAEKHDDVSTLRDLPHEIDLLTAGFPCQDLSQAGLTRGISGARSSLVAHVFRLLDARRAPLVVLENVSFMLRLEGGRAMATLVDAFAERGYRWAYRVVNSLGWLPQRRERVYVVASCCDIDPADVLFADSAAAPYVRTSLDTHAHGFYWTEGVRGLGWAPDSVPTLKNGSTVGIPSPPAILLPCGSVIKPDIRDAERLQGFPEDWTLPAERLSRRSLRWGLVGNAVSVPVAAWLGRRLVRPGRHDPSLDRPLVGEDRWPSAARSGQGGAFAVDAGAFPEFAVRPCLHDFLRHPGDPLSPRATRGFLARTDTSTLRFVPGFRERVRAHLTAVERPALAAE
jgi:DNA (cytosine-5)-methyltransferase 1